ncbi:hypothetical protein THAOC_04085, partial [Thalassiosira oceanica]
MVEVDRSHRSSAMSSTAEDLEDYRTLGDDDVEDLKPLSSSLREGKPVDMSSFFEPPGEANPPPRFEVRSMPWTDADGHSGHFTGEVNSASVPDGKGFMRYDSLPMLEGKWEEGRHVPDPGYDDMPLTSEEMRGGRPRGAGNLKTIIERSFTSQGTEAYSHLDRGDGTAARPPAAGRRGQGQAALHAAARRIRPVQLQRRRRERQRGLGRRLVRRGRDAPGDARGERQDEAAEEDAGDHQQVQDQAEQRRLAGDRRGQETRQPRRPEQRLGEEPVQQLRQERRQGRRRQDPRDGQLHLRRGQRLLQDERLLRPEREPRRPEAVVEQRAGRGRGGRRRPRGAAPGLRPRREQPELVEPRRE